MSAGTPQQLGAYKLLKPRTLQLIRALIYPVATLRPGDVQPYTQKQQKLALHHCMGWRYGVSTESIAGLGTCSGTLPSSGIDPVHARLSQGQTRGHSSTLQLYQVVAGVDGRTHPRMTL